MIQRYLFLLLEWSAYSTFFILFTILVLLTRLPNFLIKIIEFFIFLQWFFIIFEKKKIIQYTILEKSSTLLVFPNSCIIYLLKIITSYSILKFVFFLISFFLSFHSNSLHLVEYPFITYFFVFLWQEGELQVVQQYLNFRNHLLPHYLSLILFLNFDLTNDYMQIKH